MTTTALTIQQQVTSLQTDIRATLEEFFASLPEMETALNSVRSLTEQSQAVVVFRRGMGGKIEVSDPEAFVKASELVQAMQYISETISNGKDGLMDPLISRLFKAHRAATAIRSQYLNPIDGEVKRLKFEREQFAAEEERKRREAALKAQEEARKAEEARLLAEAQAAAAEGDSVAAAAIIEEAATVEAPPVSLPSRVPQVAGTSFRSVWEWELTDITKLKPEFLISNDKAIGANVRSSHKAAEQIVGIGAIKVWERKVPVDR